MQLVAATMILFAAGLVASPKEAMDQVFGGGDYQTELPTAEAPPEKPEAGDRDSIVGPLSVVARTVMWAGIVVAAILIVVALATRFGRARDSNAAHLPALGLSAGARTAEAHLRESRELAAAGRYGDAIHHLLLGAILELERRVDVSLAPSLTSREILHWRELPQSTLDALQHLVRAVEFCQFGGRAPSADDFELCCDQFMRFTNA